MSEPLVAAQLATQLGVLVKPLTTKETDIWNSSFERQFDLVWPQRNIEVLKQFKTELLLGAMIAKEQMNAEIDGESPSSGKIAGPLIIRAGFVGIGDDWEDGGTITTGTPQNWLHSGTTLLGGTAGNAIRIGDNLVVVVVGIGSLHPSPKIESFQFTIDQKTKPAVITGWPLKKSDLKLKKLNTAMIWKKNSQVLGKVFASAIFGATVTDYPYLLGVAYIPEAQLRVHDPYDLVGTSANRDVNKVIYTT